MAARLPLFLLLLGGCWRPCCGKPLNLLYILVDDLRPELGAYGVPSGATAGSPNIDKLAADSLVFERAYTQQAVCGPSRNSFLSGRRPDSTKAYTFANSFRDVGANWTSLLGFLKNKGNYAVAGQGKIYHPGSPPADDGALSWSEAFLPYPEWSQGSDSCPGSGVVYDPATERPVVATAAAAADDDEAGVPANALNGPACPLAPDANVTDHRIASLALENLAKLTASAAAAQQPWALAVGFHKPHLPWAVPSTYYDMAPDAASIPLAVHPTAPAAMPELAFWSCSESELAGYSNVNISAGTPLDDALARSWRRGYYASVRYTDAMVGLVLDGLEAAGHKDDTVVVFHGDHGWQLGEHGEWWVAACAAPCSYNTMRPSQPSSPPPFPSTPSYFFPATIAGASRPTLSWPPGCRSSSVCPGRRERRAAASARAPSSSSSTCTKRWRTCSGWARWSRAWRVARSRACSLTTLPVTTLRTRSRSTRAARAARTA